MSGKYVPPSKRNLPRVNDAQVLPDITSSRQFPSLTENLAEVSALPKTGDTFVQKAREWEQKRMNIETEKIVESRMLRYREQRNETNKFNDNILKSQLPHYFRKSAVVEPEKKQETIVAKEDEWTTVNRKQRKPKKDKVNFNEVPEELSASDGSDVDTHWDTHDKDSLWH